MTVVAGKPASLRVILSRIGRPGAISWRLFWVAYILGLVSYAASNEIDEPYEVLVGFIAASTGHLTMFMILGAAQWTFLRGPKRRPWLAILMFVEAALFRAVVNIDIRFALGLEPPESMPLRVLASTTVMTAVLMGLAIAEDAARAHARRQDLVVRREERLVQVREEIPRVIAERQREALDRIRQQLQEELVDLGSDSPPEAVSRLRRIAHDIVRPLSHDMATRVARYLPAAARSSQRGTDWWAALRDVTNGPPFQPLAWALATIVPTSAYVIDAFGVRPAGLILVVGISSSWILALLANWALPPVLRLGGVVWRAVLLTAAYLALGQAALELSWSVVRADAPLGRVSLTIGFTPLIGWMLGLAAATSRQYARTIGDLVTLTRDLEWEVARANEIQFRQQRALSRALHGPVQAAINAAALRLDSAVRRDEVPDDMVRRIQVGLQGLLDALPEAMRDDRIDPGLAFDRIRGTWEGVCDVDFDVSPEVLARLDRDQACGGAVVDIVTEACSNAVRHGKATHVRVAIEQVSVQRIRVTIEDNGSGADGFARSGLGTVMLEDVALSWRREPLTTGTRLVADLPVLATAQEWALTPA